MEAQVFDGKNTAETPARTTPNDHGGGPLILMEKTRRAPFR